MSVLRTSLGAVRVALTSNAYSAASIIDKIDDLLEIELRRFLEEKKEEGPLHAALNVNSRVRNTQGSAGCGVRK